MLGPAALEGDQITNAEPNQDTRQGSGWTVDVTFDSAGSTAFGDLSAEAACAQGDPNRIAIVLDGAIISSPGVDVPCGGSITSSTSISGGGAGFTFEQADSLAVLIEGGALPLPVTLIESREIGPTLGAAAIEASWKAALVGLALTAIFIGVIYRVVGFLATVALTSYALLAYAMLVGLGSTLTLPGLAGFVLAIGMAIDANVLVFERAREEYQAAPEAGLLRALKTGYNKAWSAILDSNVTTLLAAGLLFFLGSGPIKGFGVTVSIGVIASMVSALIIARVLTEIAVTRGVLVRHPAASGLGNLGRVREWLAKRNPDIMGRSKIWVTGSLVALAVAMGGLAVNGFNLGVEFTGGRVLEYSTSQKADIDQVRDAVAEAGFPTATVQTTDRDNVSVRVGQVSQAEVEEIQQAVQSVAGDAELDSDNEISASLGQELRDKALLAFGIALLAQMAYLAFRFKWTFGVATVVAMLHDVLLVVGIFAWLNRPIDGIFLAAIMTVIGLSVNDTVVIFDRIREKWHASRGEEFSNVANRACLDTVPRTVNTGMGAMFILAALAALGGDSLRDFALALLIGLAVGTYSSVFFATPIVIWLQKRWALARAPKVKKERDPNDSGAVV